MRRFALFAAAAAMVAAPAANAMSVAEFLTKARALQARGVFAAFSSDLPVLKAEMKGITRAYKAEIAAAKAAGRAPHSCPPPKGSPGAKIKPDALLDELEKIPPAHRNVSMKTAFYAFMKKRFPCK